MQGCTPKGYVKAEAIAPLVSRVVARHQTYVKDDVSYTGKEHLRRADLRDGTLLQKVVEAARQ